MSRTSSHFSAQVPDILRHALRLLRVCTLCFVALPAAAQSVTVAVMDAPGQSDAQVKRAHKAVLEQLKSLCALPVSDALEWKGPKRGCTASDEACQRERLKGVAALALWLTGGASVDASFWLDGARVSPMKSGSTDDAKTLLEAVLPMWMRKGWGGVRLAEPPPPGSVLKLDGRVLSSSKQLEVLPLAAGAHQLDVLFPDGHAVLQRIEVPEASRTRVELAPVPGLATKAAAPSASALRVASYAVWMAGTATLLSAFVVAFVGRQTASGQNPCALDSRECTTYAMAQEQQRAAQGYASTANVLLATGLAVGLIGVGLFTFDVLR
jgi:hypothetical protein